LEWSEQGVEGSYRFLQRVWRLAARWQGFLAGSPSHTLDPAKLTAVDRELNRKTHATIKRVTQDIEDRFHFNTVISAVMELVNTMQTMDEVDAEPNRLVVMRFALETTVLLLSPIVPHFCEELWESLGNDRSVMLMPWPTYDDAATVKDEIEVVIQVNGKLRSRFTAPLSANEDTLKEAALADEKIVRLIGEKSVKKVIVVKNKLVNIVI
jgi:leucyl-tRNA synthetase